MNNKLTIQSFIEQVENNNLDYALNSDLITGVGVVCEEDETTLCSAVAIFNFMNENPDFDGVFTVKNVLENIEIMKSMN